MAMIYGYHAHVYFDEASRASAAALRERIVNDLAGRVRVHGLIDQPIGPHPLPMFEVDVPAEQYQPVVSWLEKNHATHSILIHPITGDDLADHRDHPRWIGRPLPLNLAFLS